MNSSTPNELDDDYVQTSKEMKEELSKSILIDFFATIGLPKSFIIKSIKYIKQNFNEDFQSTEAFEYMKNEISKELLDGDMTKDMILNIYPDC